jgi:low temperature requirement protein LtrA
VNPQNAASATSLAKVAQRVEGRLQWPAPNWVDLFFDLAFAAGIIAITSAYAYNHSFGAALWYLTVYAILGSCWVLTSASTGAFTTRTRIFTTGSVALLVFQMAIVLLLAVTAQETGYENADLFVFLLGCMLIGCLALALRGERFDVHLPSSVPKLIGVGLVMLLGSLFLPRPLDIVAWGITIAALAAAAVPAIRDSEVEMVGLTHRLGELSLIIVGETLVKLVLRTGADSVWSVRVLTLVTVFVILTTTWWAYFIGPATVKRLDANSRVAWVGTHLPFHAALLGLSVGLSLAVVDSDLLNDDATILALLTGPAALVAASLAIMAKIAGDRRFPVKASGTLALVLVAVVAALMDFSSMVTVIMIAVVWLGFTLAVSPRRTAVSPNF